MTIVRRIPGASFDPTLPTVPAEPLLDLVSVAALNAWGCRLLAVDYTGPLMKVRRSSDNVEVDIGYTSTGLLDEAALLTHIGAGDGCVSKLYDQSGAARDLVETTTSKQPKIATAGVLNVVGTNNRPALLFSGAQALGNTVPQMFAAAGASALWVGEVPATAASMMVYVENNAIGGNISRYMPGRFVASGLMKFFLANEANATEADLDTTGTMTFDGSLHQFTTTDTGAAAEMRRDGAVTKASTAYTRSGTHTINFARLGAWGDLATPYTGSISEFVIFGDPLDTTDRGIAEADQKAWYGTP